MIRFRDVRFGYGDGTPVVDEASLEIASGLTLLVGPNGSGKSTLLKLAAGVERPDAGAVHVSGFDLWVDEVPARREIAYVPEQPDLTPYASVREILVLVCRLRGRPVADADQAIARVGLGGLERRCVRELSLGQRRRAVLAAATIGNPRLLLLDEPLEAMDRGMRDEIVSWVERSCAAGAAAIIATHEIEPFEASARRALTIAGGRVSLVDPLPGDRAARRSILEDLARGSRHRDTPSLG